MALITYSSEYLKAKLGTLTGSQQTTCTELIKAAQNAIESFCKRKFELADYLELVEIGQLGEGFLRNYPLASVTGVWDRQSEVLNLTHSGSSSASANVTDTSLRLISVTSGVTTVTELTFASYATLAALETAIELISGWSVTVASGYGDYPSSDLVSGQFVTCKTGGNLLSWLPSEEHFIFNTDVGTIRFFCEDYQIVKVKYRGGFSVVPEGIQQVCANMVAYMLDKTTGIQSENLGDYSYTLAQNAVDSMPLQDKQILNLYRDRRV